MIGQENGTSDWVLIDQDRINRFADATEDHQWVDPCGYRKSEKRTLRRPHRPWFFNAVSGSLYSVNRLNICRWKKSGV